MPSYRMGTEGVNHVQAKDQSAKKKILYIPLQRFKDGMTNAEKEGVRLWNLMVTTLRDNGLMEDKK